MTDNHTDDAHPATCENCGTALEGAFCHRCGQSVHSPVRNLGHAIEEVFESFWHLDGRIFRTMRDLVVPGRVACNYLAGHRQRYVAPMRLFVILSLLTFFVAQAMVDTGGETASRTRYTYALSNAVTEGDVTRLRDAELARHRRHADRQRDEAARKRFADETAEIGHAADRRLVELREDGATRRKGFSDIEPGAGEVRVDWLPGFANDWINRQGERALYGLQRAEADPMGAFRKGIGGLPTALFLMLPVFALLLKLAYFFTGRRYLEHMVVALYSHAFLLVAMLALFALAALESVVAGIPVLPFLRGLAIAAVWIWIPVYLYLMQWRVYRQSWWLTGIKYFVIGNVHSILLSLVIAYATFYSLVNL